MQWIWHHVFSPSVTTLLMSMLYTELRFYQNNNHTHEWDRWRIEHDRGKTFNVRHCKGCPRVQRTRCE